MPRFKPQVPGAGVLFPQAARSTFVELTASRYQGMMKRLQKKKPPIHVPFNLEMFRADIKRVMGGTEDGAIMCRYCRRWFTLSEIAIDHAFPLSRGGSPGLDNIDFPCKQDNDRKGSMSVPEYLKLLDFLESCHPLMRTDILSRLEKSNKLAAGARRAQMLAAQLKKPPKPPEDDEEEDDPLGPF